MGPRGDRGIDVHRGPVAPPDEFGYVLTDTNPGPVPFAYAGGLYDPTTRLVRFGARDYDRRVGRFSNRDPILFAGRDTNLYAYTWSDPINWIDPEGLDGRAAAAAALGEVGSDKYGYADPHPESRGRVTSALDGRKSNGHVGIFVPLPGGAPGTVSAAAGLDGEVVSNNWGFRRGQTPTIRRRGCDGAP